MIPPKSKPAAFSLVEVALAIGIIAFAFVALISLLPAGLTTFRRALDISICTQIAQRIVGEAQEVDFDVFTDAAKLPASAVGKEFSFRAPNQQQPRVRYFDEQGSEIVPARPPELSDSDRFRLVYQVNVRIIPRVVLPTGSGSSAEGFPMPRAVGQSGSLAQITVQIARNPSTVPLTLSPGNADDPNASDRNLWLPKGGVDIFTYSTYIAKNK